MIELFLFSLIGGAVANHVYNKHLKTDKNLNVTVENYSPYVWVEGSSGISFRTIPDGVTYHEFAKNNKITTPQQYEEDKNREEIESISNRTPEEQKWWSEIEVIRGQIRNKCESIQREQKKSLEYIDPPKSFYDRGSIEGLIRRGLDHRSSEIPTK